jgi:hypothetical protein
VDSGEAVDDIAKMTELLYALIRTEIENETINWTIEYNATRFSPEQRAIINRCIRVIGGMDDARIDIRPHGRSKGPVIAVTCERGQTPIGKGHININIEEDIEVHDLRVVNALSVAIALAARSSLGSSRIDRMRRGRLIDFINEGYEALTGVPLGPEMFFEDETRSICGVIIKTLRPIRPELITPYNTMVFALLTSV